MKILHIISSNGIYGAENVLLNLLESLQQSSWCHVQLICLRSSKKSEPDIYFEAQKRGIEAQVYFCKSKVDKEAIERIGEHVQKNEVDLIHTHGYKSNFYGLKTAVKTGVPVVASLHGWTGESLKIKMYDALDKGIIRKMDFAICVSPKIGVQIVQSGMPQKKVKFIPNGIDVKKYREGFTSGSLRGELGLQGPVVVGTVGRLSPEKGQSYLIKAFKDIHEVYDDAKLLIVGDGPLKDELKAQAKKLGLLESVIFAGQRENMCEVYNSMDVFVLPSRTEGIPIALLEAMSMGLAVVATKVGGVPFVLEGDAGKLVKKENTRELAEAVSFFLEKKKLREEYGQRARRRVEEKFTIGQMASEYKNVYEGVLAKRLAGMKK